MLTPHSPVIAQVRIPVTNCSGAMRHGLLLLLIPLVLFRLVTAKDEWMYERFFGITDRAILSPTLDGDPEGKAALRFMLNYYQDLEANLTQPAGKKVDLDPLKLKNIPSFVRFFGWPKLNALVQQLYLPVRPRDPVNPRRRTEAEKNDLRRYGKQKDQFKATERLVFKALAAFGKGLDKSGEIVKRTLGWDKVYHNYRQNYTTESKTHTCKMRANLAYRINRRWAALAVVTNDVMEANLADRKRFYLSEYMYIDDSNTVRAQPFFFNMSFETKKYKPAQHWVGGRLAPTPNRTRATTMRPPGVAVQA